MSNLNDQQFAKYSSIEDSNTYDKHPLPSSMERHAPGEYQPTLPGMEHMLPGEQTHTSVFFPKPKPEVGEWGDPYGSRWGEYSKVHGGEQVRMNPRDLHPMQDWLEDRNLHTPYQREASQIAYRGEGRRPLVENVEGTPILQDGHHRTARAILNGAQQIEVRKWDSRG